MGAVVRLREARVDFVVQSILRTLRDEAAHLRRIVNRDRESPREFRNSPVDMALLLDAARNIDRAVEEMNVTLDGLDADNATALRRVGL